MKNSKKRIIAGDRTMEIEETVEESVKEDFSEPMDDESMQFLMVNGVVWKSMSRFARANKRSLADEFSNCFNEYCMSEAQKLENLEE